ncbi:hypothetical protein DVH24_008868 [Malus domestica]|uniref:RING-CH-type domain-containing protein n=1 Tax=Malus domestica TaxID=3750 RepID=A0A498JR93_MALDO|nr:hypothetical protein DVH24_008868 [Malus domestica]
MGDHLVLCVDHFTKPESLQGSETPGSSVEGSCSHSAELPTCAIDVKGVGEKTVSEEEEPLIQTVECRICQEEDSVKNLEVPCSCSGSLKFAHRKCVQRWCNEKGDIICEICHQLWLDVIRTLLVFVYFFIPTRIIALPFFRSIQHTALSMTLICFDLLLFCFLDLPDSDGWTISGTPLDLRDPRLLAMAAAERHFLEAEYDEYADTNASGAAFCRSAALILMALLLLRHALTLPNGDGDDDDASTFFSLFLLRAAGFLLPCYIMAWAISILQRRRQRQEAAALAATEVAFMLQAGQRRGLQFTIAPGPAVTPHQEPIQ